MIVRNMPSNPMETIQMYTKKNTGPSNGCASCKAWKSKAPKATANNSSQVYTKLEKFINTCKKAEGKVFLNVFYKLDFM